MKRIVCVLTCLSLFLIGCQKSSNDSEDKFKDQELRKILDNASDLIADGDYSKSASEIHRVLPRALISKDSWVKASLHANIGLAKYRMSEYDSAMYYYDLAIKYSIEDGDSALLGRNLRRMANSLKRESRFSESARMFETALDLAVSNYDTANVASIANGLSGVLVELLDFSYALSYNKMAIDSWLAVEDSANFSIAVHNRGDALRGMGRLEESLNTYKRALKLKRDLNRTSSSAYTLTGMGRTYLLMDSINQADEVLQEAIDIRSKFRNKNSYAESLLIMSRVSAARKQYVKAERQLKEVEQIARDNKKADLLRDAFEDQRALYKKWDRFIQLAEVDELYDIMTDSLYREEKLKVQEAQSTANLQREQQRTEIAEQNARLNALERDAEKQKSQFRLIVAILAFMGLLVIAWQLLQIRKRNATLIALNERIKLITDNAFHSQKNALGLISALMRSKARQTDNQKELEVIKDVEGKIEALGGVAKYLFQRRIEDNTAVAARVQLKTYLEELVEDTFSSVASNADLDMEVEDIETTSTEALNVGLITNEAVTNFSKYAETQGAETLMIRVLKKAENLLLTFIDDGPGFPKDFDFSNSTGFGMQMMANLVADMEGTIHLNREDDLTQIDISIPLKS